MLMLFLHCVSALCFCVAQERRLTAGQVLHHPWMQQSLLPDQQAAWEDLQREQQQLTQDIALKSDVYKVRGGVLTRAVQTGDANQGVSSKQWELGS
jgi:hypothetical protein